MLTSEGSELKNALKIIMPKDVFLDLARHYKEECKKCSLSVNVYDITNKDKHEYDDSNSLI